jgi:hypothetical protein
MVEQEPSRSSVLGPIYFRSNAVDNPARARHDRWPRHGATHSTGHATSAGVSIVVPAKGSVMVAGARLGYLLAH